MIIKPSIFFSSDLRVLLTYCFIILENAWAHFWQRYSCWKNRRLFVLLTTVPSIGHNLRPWFLPRSAAPWLGRDEVVPSELGYLYGKTQRLHMCQKQQSSADSCMHLSEVSLGIFHSLWGGDLPTGPVSKSLPLISQDQSCPAFCTSYRKLIIVYKPTRL